MGDEIQTAELGYQKKLLDQRSHRHGTNIIYSFGLLNIAITREQPTSPTSPTRPISPATPKTPTISSSLQVRALDRYSPTLTPCSH